MLVTFFTLCLVPAEAGTTTVLYGSGEPTMALARVQAADPRAGDLIASTLSELLADTEASLTGAALTTCQGNPTTLEAIASLQTQIEGMVGYMEFENALTTLSQATASLACVRDRLDENIAPRLYFLEGIAAHGASNVQRAKAAFAAALVFNPELAWDDYFAPDAKSLLDLAASEMDQEARVKVTLSPTPDAGALWVDGYPASSVPLELVPGDHLVQVLAGRLRTFRLTLSAGTPATLVIPEAIGNERADWVGEPKTRTDLDSVLAMYLEPGRTLYFSTPDGVWRTEVGTGEWEVMEAKSEIVTSSDIPTKKSRSVSLMSSGLTVAGSAITGSGLLLTGVSRVMGQMKLNEAQGVCSTAKPTCTLDDWNIFYSHSETYKDWQDRLKIGYLVSAGGAAITGTGILFTRDTSLSLAPWANSQGAGLVVSRTR